MFVRQNHIQIPYGSVHVSFRAQRASIATETIYSEPMTADSNGWTGYTLRNRFETSVLAAPSFTPTQMRIGLAASTTRTSLQFGANYVGHYSGSGNAWNTGTLTQIFWGGNAGATIPGGTGLLSDWFNFVWNGTSPLIITLHVNGNASNDGLRRVANGSGRSIHHKPAVNEAGSQTPTGYATDTSHQLGVTIIEVR